MGLDGLLAEGQLLGDGPVGVAVDDEPQHLALALAEAQGGSRPELAAVQSGRGECHPTGQHRVHHDVAGEHPAERIDQLFGHDLLGEVAGCAGPQALEQVLLVVIDSEQYDLGPGCHPEQVPAQFETAGGLHAHVDEGHIGFEVDHQAASIVDVGCGRRHLDVTAVRAQHGDQAVEDHLVIVDHHDPDRAADVVVGHRLILERTSGGPAVPPRVPP